MLYDSTATIHTRSRIKDTSSDPSFFRFSVPIRNRRAKKYTRVPSMVAIGAFRNRRRETTMMVSNAVADFGPPATVNVNDDVWVIVPAYNEGGRLGRTLQTLCGRYKNV